jgi:hypothetical protein
MTTGDIYRKQVEIIRRAIESCEAARSLYSAEAEVIAIAVHEALSRHLFDAALAADKQEFYALILSEPKRDEGPHPPFSIDVDDDR